MWKDILKAKDDEGFDPEWENNYPTSKKTDGYDPNYLREIQSYSNTVEKLALNIEKKNPSSLDNQLLKTIVDSLRNIKEELMPKLAESIETDGEGWFD